MTDPLKASFDAIAQEYDAHRRQLIPCYDDFYRITTDLATAGRQDLRVLDLGAGTGLMTWHILEKRPAAVCTLIDFAEEMLNIAKKRFAGQSNVSYVTGDYRNFDPGSGYDVIVSSLSIHHLDDRDKELLYCRLFGLLADGGIFVNADQVLGATTAIEAEYQQRWREKIAESDLTAVEKSAAFERMKMDRPATLDNNLRWLRESGFRDVDVYYKYYTFAVMAGRK
ncbi:MAG TPA: methyltransferase domain-containing protein [Methanocella sp.]